MVQPSAHRPFVLIPGAGGEAWYWNLVVERLTSAGSAAAAVDLPGDDETAGLDAYADLVIAAIAGRVDAIVVAQSMGGFTAPLVAARAPVGALVLVNAMIPVPGETPGDWWDATGSEAARVAAAEAGGYGTEFDLDTYFLPDVPTDVAAQLRAGGRDEVAAAFDSPCRFEAWPDVPITVLAGEGDRFFPIDFQRRVARERLGLDAEALPGGHLNALSHPDAVAARLLRV